MIELVSEELARATKVPGGGGGQQVAFVKVHLGVGMGSVVAREYDVAATPTFGFLLGGKYQVFSRMLILGCANDGRWI